MENRVKSLEEMRQQIESEMENMKQPLFSKEPSAVHGHPINAWLGRGWDTYAEGYLLAGHALVDHLLRTKGFDQDFLIYPIVFMYRQYLELRLKELLRSGKALLDQSLGDKEAWGHDILSLWRKVRPLLEQVWPESSREGWHHLIEARIAELAATDQKSMAFRYPDVPMAGLEAPKNYINPVHVRTVMIGISHVLEGSSIGMGEYLNAKNEMEAEYRQEMEAEMRAEWEAEYRAHRDYS